MQITKDTRISAILLEYGDIAEVMEVFGVQRVGKQFPAIVPSKSINGGMGSSSTSRTA